MPGSSAGQPVAQGMTQSFGMGSEDPIREEFLVHLYWNMRMQAQEVLLSLEDPSMTSDIMQRLRCIVSFAGSRLPNS